MNNQELEKRNKTLERRWKIMLALAIIFLITRPVALLITKNKIKEAATNATKNNYPLTDPARQLTPQEDYIINLTDLRKYLHELGNKYPDTLSIYYEQVNSGSNISVNKDVHLFPASLSKLVQAIIAAKKVEAGTWKWDQEFKAEPADLSSDSGELYKTIGTNSITLEELLKQMLVNSDNTAQNIIRRNLSLQDYLDFQEEVGLEDLYNDKGFISAKEYTRVLRVLYTSSYLERQNSEKILEYMSEATFNDYLSQGVPTDVKFAHKYGENKEQSIFADSGIVYIPGRPYMLTVILKGPDSSDTTRQWAVDLMKEISQKAYNIGKK